MSIKKKLYQPKTDLQHLDYMKLIFVFLLKKKKSKKSSSIEKSGSILRAGPFNQESKNSIVRLPLKNNIKIRHILHDWLKIFLFNFT